MNTSDISHDDQSRGEVGIAVARHVYGPANVHLLPCKVHHTGFAPVSTYFRPQPPLPEGIKNATPVAEEEGDNGVEKGEKSSARVASELNTVAVCKGKDEQAWVEFEANSSEHTARFRGRKLIGRKVELLPKGIHGVVLREQPCPEGLREDEDVTSFWAAETSFQDITVWGHDEIRRQSTVDRCLGWLEVSNSVRLKERTFFAGTVTNATRLPRNMKVSSAKRT